MEHVIQIGVNVDDERIEQAVINQTSREISKKVTEAMFRTGYNNSVIGFTERYEGLMRDAVAKHKDEIIKRAAEMVADSIKHSKKYREFLAALGNGE